MSHHVYFIRAVGSCGPVKIGCSDAPHERLRSYCSWSPAPLEIVATIAGDFKLERRFHALFREARSHHEWFHPTPEVLAVIAAIRRGDFDVDALPAPRRLPQSGNTSDSIRAGVNNRRITQLQKAGVSVPREVVLALHTYRMPSEEVARRRALVAAFVEQNFEKAEAA